MSDKNRTPHRKGSLFITLGLLMIALALFLAGYNRFDATRAGESAGTVREQLQEALPSVTPAEAPSGSTAEQPPAPEDVSAPKPDDILYADMEMPVETVDGVDYIGILTIPALSLELPIASQWSYQHLKTSPCRYSGSAYTNNMIICGHNYISHFADLKSLRQGDIATFTDMNGTIFSYQVTEQETIHSEDLAEMDSGDWDLTLFTCTVGGQSRVTVRFELEEKDADAY